MFHQAGNAYYGNITAGMTMTYWRIPETEEPAP